jgi:hypothetical protein
MTNCESEDALHFEKAQSDGHGVMGCSRAMFANRISYWLDTHGKLKCGNNNLLLLISCQNL